MVVVVDERVWGCAGAGGRVWAGVGSTGCRVIVGARVAVVRSRTRSRVIVGTRVVVVGSRIRA